VFFKNSEQLRKNIRYKAQLLFLFLEKLAQDNKVLRENVVETAISLTKIQTRKIW
jgi:hypothetical protein